MKKIYNFIKSIFFNPIFYWSWLTIILLLFLGYWFNLLFIIGKYAFFALIAITLLDFIYLFFYGNIEAKRKLPEKFSNGDANPVHLLLKNNYPTKVHLKIIDELPKQFQKRDFELFINLNKEEQIDYSYSLRPVKRGVYNFGVLNIFVSSPLRLARVRRQFEGGKDIKVYPSFIQMRKYELIAFANKLGLGLKKIRRIGHTMEFEQIKTYNKGDDYRTINWKATAKLNKLMVNQYQDEKSQNVYSVIDLGRTMKLPFKGMTLLDYAINSTLSFSNIAMKKQDNAGLLTFEKNIREFLKPNKKKSALHHIFEALYAVDTQYNETDYERLYTFIKHKIPTRSLLMIYSNFEHLSSLRRQLPFLRKLAQKHLIVLIIFENTELKSLIEEEVNDNRTLYHKIIAQDFDWQKRMMIKELKINNIHSIYTSPEKLTLATINKYLELKARGLI